MAFLYIDAIHNLPLTLEISDLLGKMPSMTREEIRDHANTQAELWQKRVDEATSDASYWSRWFDYNVWKAVSNIMEAAMLNDGEVEKVDPPELSGATMDVIARIHKYGEQVLKITKFRIENGRKQ